MDRGDDLPAEEEDTHSALENSQFFSKMSDHVAHAMFKQFSLRQQAALRLTCRHFYDTLSGVRPKQYQKTVIIHMYDVCVCENYVEEKGERRARDTSRRTFNLRGQMAQRVLKPADFSRAVITHTLSDNWLREAEKFEFKAAVVELVDISFIPTADHVVLVHPNREEMRQEMREVFLERRIRLDRLIEQRRQLGGGVAVRLEDRRRRLRIAEREGVFPVGFLGEEEVEMEIGRVFIRDEDHGEAGERREEGAPRDDGQEGEAREAGGEGEPREVREDREPREAEEIREVREAPGPRLDIVGRALRMQAARRAAAAAAHGAADEAPRPAPRTLEERIAAFIDWLRRREMDYISIGEECDERLVLAVLTEWPRRVTSVKVATWPVPADELLYMPVKYLRVGCLECKDPEMLFNKIIVDWLNKKRKIGDWQISFPKNQYLAPYLLFTNVQDQNIRNMGEGKFFVKRDNFFQLSAKISIADEICTLSLLEDVSGILFEEQLASRLRLTSESGDFNDNDYEDEYDSYDYEDE